MTVRVVVDTCVVSELNKAVPNIFVRQAIEDRDDGDLFLSVMTMGEIARGIGLLPPGGKRQALETWASETEQRYGDRILTIDLETAKIWAAISSDLRKRGQAVSTIDGLIAATALRHGLAVMTRNVRDFEPTGVAIVDPWEGT